MIVSNKATTFLMASATSAGVLVGNAPTALSSADHFVIWFLGVGFSTLLMANIGAMLAMVFAEPIRPQTKMWALFVSSSMLGAASVAVLPHAPGFSWVGNAPTQAIALVVGFFARWAIPALIEHLPAKLKSLLGGK